MFILLICCHVASLGKITFTLFFKCKVRPVVIILKAELKESVTWLINLYTGPPQLRSR